VLRDRRGTSKAEIPDVDFKSETLGDPLATYKPTGAKHVDAARAMDNFTAGRSRPSTPSPTKPPTSSSTCSKSTAARSRR